MPIVSISPENPFVDGRQSQRALEVRMGVEKYFEEKNWVTLPELTLKTGRRADLVALSPKGEICIVEVKSSVTDFKTDQKWPDYKAYCDQFFFATLNDVPAEIFPQEVGLMVADSYAAEVLRESAEHKVAAARRRSLHLQFARAASARLTRCCAHAGFDGRMFATVED